MMAGWSSSPRSLLAHRLSTARSRTVTTDPCGPMSTRSLFSRPAARIASSSDTRCGRMASNIELSFLVDGPVEDDLAAQSGVRDSERLFELPVRVPVRDDRRYVQPGLRENRHLVPSLEDLAAIDALDGQHLEQDLRPVDRELVVGKAQDRDAATMRHVRDHVAQRARLPRHLEGHVETLFHAEVFLSHGERVAAHVARSCHPYFAR